MGREVGSVRNVIVLSLVALVSGACSDHEGKPAPEHEDTPAACGNGIDDDEDGLVDCDDDDCQIFAACVGGDGDADGDGDVDADADTDADGDGDGDGDADCGNGAVDPGEDCDDANDDDTDDCVHCLQAGCGDGHVWAGHEDCDDANDDDTDDCVGCARAACADGVVWEGMEGCDDGNEDDTDDCVACTPAACGDGAVWAGHEACDDGNDVDTDGCVDCAAAYCGDGLVWEGQEACDDGNDVDTDDCVDCADASCGDGFVWAGREACDDGNDVDGDDCARCLPAGCGDGFVWAGHEDCDDANAVDTDDCVDCVRAACGDGLVWAGHEDCDDANAIDTDGCVRCALASCGDGFVWAGREVCDDGNADDTDDCVACARPTCGDGFVWFGHEACDDGNAVDTDDCVACMPASCGDGFVWAGHEVCDDGNVDTTDDCPRCAPARCGDAFVWNGHEGCDDGNAVDTDDCVGCLKADCGDGFVWAGHEDCELGQSQDCAAQCPGSGTQTCDAFCQWGRCEPPSDVVALHPGDVCTPFTRECLGGCNTASCEDACLRGEPNRDECVACTDQNLIHCANAAGCQTSWDAYACCVAANCPGGDDACIAASCAAEGASYDGCVAALPPATCDVDVDACFAAACETVLASDDFESTSVGERPAGWLDGCMGGTTYDWQVTSTAIQGTHGLELDFTGGPGEAAVGIPVRWPAAGVTRVSFWFQPETTTENIYILPVRNDQRLFNAIPFLRTGMLQDQTTAYAAGRWYHVTYDIDFDQSSFREWVDGVRVLSGPFALEDVPCALAGGDYLSFHGGYVDQKYLGHVDDVRVVDYPIGCEQPNCALWSATQDARVRVIDTAGLFTSDFTVEMWANFDSFADTDPGQRLITAIGSGPYELLYLRAYQGNFECVIGTGNGFLSARVPVAQMQAGRWYHVACTHDDAELALWLDGLKVGTAAGLPYGIPDDSALGLAGDHREPPDAAQQFLGKIDEVRFSDVVEYTDTFTPQPRLGPTPHTLSLWHFDECAGTTAADAVSPGAHVGTLEYGADWAVPY